MTQSSKLSRKGIAPLYFDLSRKNFFKRKFLFKVDEQDANRSSSNGQTAEMAMTQGRKEDGVEIGIESLQLHDDEHDHSKTLPPIEILFNPCAVAVDATTDEPKAPTATAPPPPPSDDPFTDLVHRVTEGLAVHPPDLCEEGINGTYFLKDKSGRKIAIFKPCDEEGDDSPKSDQQPPSAFLHDDEIEEDLQVVGELELEGVVTGAYPSPKHIRRHGVDKQISVEDMKNQISESAQHEVAAYIMDERADGFYNVPKTGIVAIHPNSCGCSKTCKHLSSFFASTKIGSLQEFVESDGASWDVGSSLFPVKEVHKIGILDIQIVNNDRHGGNILIKKPANFASPQKNMSRSFPTALFNGGRYGNEQGPPSNGRQTFVPSSSWSAGQRSNNEFVLTPIDHGYSLPHRLGENKDLWFDWITWPQAKRPFDQETRLFIETINEDVNGYALQSQLNISPDSIRVMKITTTLLKKCAQAGWTLYEIAQVLIHRKDKNGDTQLEQLVVEAEQETQKLVAQQFDKCLPQEEKLFLQTLSRLIDEQLIEPKLHVQSN